MELFDKINYLIEEKGLNKKKFTDIFLSLEPRLRTTGNPPSKGSIYSYLSGKREIKVELIPYIAEALGVREQELFEFNIEYASEFNRNQSKEVREIIELLQYLPNNKLRELKDALLKYKILYNEKILKE